jgi:hypothetical protein
VIGIAQAADQSNRLVAEYVGKKLAKRNAVHAGDAAFQSQPRKFGFLWIESNSESKKTTDDFTGYLQQNGVTLAASIPYTLDPARLQEQATSAIVKLKQAGVTSVIFSGDPVAPATFTKEATAQDYSPEWILGAQALVDTTAFARTYDQKQWAHAFGVSSLTARFDPTKSDSFFLYQWFTGTTPPAIDSNGVLFPQPAIFFGAIQTAGPKLTPETFRDGLFAAAPTPNAITQASLSYGQHNLWPYTDFDGTDDVTEVWWNPTATGPDEIRKTGTGMWEYVDGGKRFLPGSFTTDDSKVFDPAGAIDLLETRPAAETPKDYPSPAKK